MRRANIGCGADVRPGYVNVDSYKHPGVDKAFDLDDRHWPLPDAGFDEVLASHVIEHVQDPMAFLSECARILAPGGRLIVYVPFWKNAKATWGNFDHKRAIHPHAFQAFGPGGAKSTDLLQASHGGLFDSIQWRRGDRPHRWGESRFLRGFLRLGRSRLGFFTHLWYRLRWTRFLDVEEIRLDMVRSPRTLARPEPPA